MKNHTKQWESFPLDSQLAPAADLLREK